MEQEESRVTFSRWAVTASESNSALPLGKYKYIGSVFFYSGEKKGAAQEETATEKG